MKTYFCPNCGAVHERLAVEFPDIPDLLARIAPGEPVPAGECPDCGALVHARKATASAPMRTATNGAGPHLAHS